jgi:hypothetical protein
MRRTLVVIAVVIAAFALLGYLAHTFDLVGLARSLHGGGPAQHE